MTTENQPEFKEILANKSLGVNENVLIKKFILNSTVARKVLLIGEAYLQHTSTETNYISTNDFIDLSGIPDNTLYPVLRRLMNLKVIQIIKSRPRKIMFCFKTGANGFHPDNSYWLELAKKTEGVE